MNGRGILYRDQGRYELAEAEFTKSLGLEPTNYPAFFGRGLSRFAAGRYGAAAEDFASAQKVGSDDLSTYLPVWLYIAMVGTAGSTSPFWMTPARCRI